jgi:hypothetical protein
MILVGWAQLVQRNGVPVRHRREQLLQDFPGGDEAETPTTSEGRACSAVKVNSCDDHKHVVRMLLRVKFDLAVRQHNLLPPGRGALDLDIHPLTVAPRIEVV